MWTGVSRHRVSDCVVKLMTGDSWQCGETRMGTCSPAHKRRSRRGRCSRARGRRRRRRRRAEYSYLRTTKWPGLRSTAGRT